MRVISTNLICEKVVCFNFSSYLISDFTENTTVSSGVFEQAVTRRKKQRKDRSTFPQLHHLNLPYTGDGAGHCGVQ